MSDPSDSMEALVSAPGPVRFGMVGGGAGAFIGEVHRLAARLDGTTQLVCGAFSRDASNSAATGAALGLAPGRAYRDYAEMFALEARLPQGERMEFVAIVTPNHMHFPVARAALEAGFHVLSDKPATLSLAEARELRAVVARTGLAYGLTHTYLGYPMVREAARLVRDGAIGAVRKIYVDYVQGWLSAPDAGKQAAWRTDPARSGPSGAMGDIGTHAHNLAEFVAGARMTEVAAELTAFVPGRRLDDDGSALFRMEGGIRGVLNASQVCVGVENDLSIRIYGETGGLEWHHGDPASLRRTHADRPTEILRAGQDYLGRDARSRFRLPPGHPEGYIEAFANIYRDFAAGLRNGDAMGEATSSGINEAVRGMAFVEAVVESSTHGGRWTAVEP